SLMGIDEVVMGYHPDAEKTIKTMVPAWRQWSTMDDEVAPVLIHIADSMDELAAAIQKRAVGQEARFGLVKRTD
ncbi:MAG: hypothetical protein JWR74_2827, partial [Polaromonas sp.]|nr:hypothetical protein [Polaromonas sp.]